MQKYILQKLNITNKDENFLICQLTGTVFSQINCYSSSRRKIISIKNLPLLVNATILLDLVACQGI